MLARQLLLVIGLAVPISERVYLKLLWDTTSKQRPVHCAAETTTKKLVDRKAMIGELELKV